MMEPFSPMALSRQGSPSITKKNGGNLSDSRCRGKEFLRQNAVISPRSSSWFGKSPLCLSDYSGDCFDLFQALGIKIVKV